MVGQLPRRQQLVRSFQDLAERALPFSVSAPNPNLHNAHRTGLHLRPAREPDHHAGAARARWAAATLDGTVRPAEPRLDRVAARRRVRRGVLEWPRRQRQRCTPALA